MIRYTIRKEIGMRELGRIGVKRRDLKKEYIKIDREVPLLHLLRLFDFKRVAIYKNVKKDEYVVLPEFYMRNSIPAKED